MWHSLLRSPILIIVGTQILFTGGDLLARANMKVHGFKPATFVTGWFLLYFLIRQVAMLGQLYLFASVELGRAMAMFGAVSIILSNGLGLLLLGEVLSVQGYLGVVFAVGAFVVLAFS